MLKGGGASVLNGRSNHCFILCLNQFILVSAYTSVIIIFVTTFNTELRYCISLEELLLSWVWFDMSRKCQPGLMFQKVKASERIHLLLLVSSLMSRNLPVIDYKTPDRDMWRPVGFSCLLSITNTMEQSEAMTVFLSVPSTQEYHMFANDKH